MSPFSNPKPLLCLIIGLAGADGAMAEPWLEPGDLALRHDIQLLADEGVIQGPVSSWPLSWGDLATSLDHDVRDLSIEAELALYRVRRRAEADTRLGWDLHGRVSAAANPRQIRTFEDEPREDAEIELGVSWTGSFLAGRLQGQWVEDPQDGEDLRADGSYAGLVLGNWMMSVGLMDRWWGPGWQGSLILGNNARPLPALAVERNFTEPFEHWLLSWMGPWDLTVMLGIMNDDDRAVDDPLYFGLRYNFRPLQNLEIALSRTAQFCGNSSCSISEFWDMLFRNEGKEENNANQLAGFDVRWSYSLWGQPFALYTQWIGEDETNFIPTDWLGLFGGEIWGSAGRYGNWRAILEWADTSCDFRLYRSIRGDEGPGSPNCAYNSARYKTGYRYWGRSVGHSYDNDASVFTLMGVLSNEQRRSWILTANYGKLNRQGVPDPRNNVAEVATDYVELSLSHRRPFFIGDLALGIGADNREIRATGEDDTDYRVFAEWTVAY